MAEEVPARGNVLGRCLPARYILAMLGSIGMAIVYGLKVNLSVTMVAMINHTAMAGNIHNNTIGVDNDECKGSSNDGGGPLEDGPFTWSEPLQGTLLSCYFWGYLVSQIPGARIAETFSAKWVMFFAVAINVVCTLLTPVMTNLHYGGLMAMRVLEGVGGGATFPAMHCMIAAWAPPNERSVMSTIIYVGTSFGTMVSILMAGELSHYLGWESVFYVMGGLSCVWMLLWLMLVQDNPNKQRLISLEERQMITSKLGTQQAGRTDEEHPPVPWGSVWTSVPFWAIFIAHFCSNFAWYMFLIEIPFYMKQVLKFNVANNSVFSALPYFPMLLFSIALGKTLDILRDKNKITTTVARKTATGIATVVPAACLLALCYIGCLHVVAVVLMTIGIVGIGGMFSGFLSNHIDIAPKYAGTLVALTNTFATVPGIVVPIFVGFVTHGNQTIDAWRIIFYVTIVALLIEFVVFTLFGSGEEQPWSKGVKKRRGQESTPLKTTAATN